MCVLDSVTVEGIVGSGRSLEKASIETNKMGVLLSTEP